MIEYIDFKIDFTKRNDRLNGITLDRVTTRSYDTAIKFRIEIIGHTLDDTYDVKILTKYHKSGLNVMTTLGDSLEIVDGKIIYTPKVNLITEADYVRNYLYLSKDGLGLDMAQFNYQVDVSQIGEVAVEVRQVYDESYETLLAEFEQALEDYKLTLPQADSVRAEIDVVLSQFGVDSQAKLSQYDADVQQVIADSQTAFGLAETGRQNNYEQAETDRNQASNQAVADWEQDADALLDTVEGNESARVDAEANRKTAETDRVSSESTRKTNETTRISNEIARQQAELDRQAQEEAREANEGDRVQAEIERVSKDGERDSKIEAVEGRLDATDIPIKNLITNGSFENDFTGWSDFSGSSIGTRTISTEHKLDGSKSFKIVKLSNEAGSFGKEYSDLPLVEGNKYYTACRVYQPSSAGNLGKFTFQLGNFSIESIPNAVDVWSKLNFIVTATSTESVKLLLRTNTGANIPITVYIDNVIVIDLTKTFGAGNEPTKEEMDELIKITGYFDEITLTQKQLLNWQLKLMRQNRNALIALGGTII